MRVILLTQHARRSENLVVKKIICFLPSSYFSATQQGVGTDEAKTNALASCKTTHLPTNCPYLELFILFSSACSKQSKQYCRVFEQERYLSIHLKPYGYTPQLYSLCAPRTVHVLRHTHMHTPCVLYTTPARTARPNRTDRTRTPRAPYAYNARTVRTPRTHTPHAPYAHPARTHRTPRAHPFSYQNGRVQVKTLFSPFLDLAKYIYIYIWVNYNDLTATSLGIMVNKGNHPQMALIRLVKYYNLPRYIYIYIFIYICIYSIYS